MFKILSKYLDLFKHKENTKPTNSVLFEIDNNNNIDVKIKLNNALVDDAEKFGLLLFLINEGYYVQTFLDILSDISKEGEHQAKFVQTTIHSWASKVTESNIYETNIKNECDPIIKPTQFNISK